MKNFFLVIIFSVALFSCSDDTVSKSKTEATNVSSVLRLTNPDDQRIAYTLLSQTEKYNLWIGTLTDLLNDSTLSTAQKNLIQDLKNHTSLDVFSDVTNSAKEYFKDIYVPGFLTSAQTLFTNDQIEGYFYRLSRNLSSDGVVLTEKGCNCNQDSMFGCGASNDCEGKKCTSTNSGCGFFMAWECNGLCSFTW